MERQALGTRLVCGPTGSANGKTSGFATRPFARADVPTVVTKRFSCPLYSTILVEEKATTNPRRQRSGEGFLRGRANASQTHNTVVRNSTVLWKGGERFPSQRETPQKLHAVVPWCFTRLARFLEATGNDLGYSASPPSERRLGFLESRPERSQGNGASDIDYIPPNERRLGVLEAIWRLL